jgi:hypothetical protein
MRRRALCVAWLIGEAVTDATLSPLQKARLFARYAYVPEPRWEILDHFASDEFAALKRDLAGLSRNALIQFIGGVTRDVFQEIFANAKGEIIVPLSGGRDSRLILCMARELGLADRVMTLTWGPRDGLDSSIAAAVSARLRIRHVRIDPREHAYTFATLRRAFKSGAHWTDLVLAHFNQKWKRYAGHGATAVIGYLGGPPVGVHYQLGEEAADFSEAIARFDRLNARAPNGPSMVGDVQHRLIDRSRISYAEQLDLVYRQEGYLRRIVAGPDPRVRAPFAHPTWLKACYALPAAHRVGSNLYSAYLTREFPDAFSIGVSGAYGLRCTTPSWRRRAQRRMMIALHDAVNARRRAHFATFDKYGDERDLFRGVRAMLRDTNARALVRLLSSRKPTTAEEAAVQRRRAMLLCNWLIESQLRAQNSGIGANRDLRICTQELSVLTCNLDRSASFTP